MLFFILVLIVYKNCLVFNFCILFLEKKELENNMAIISPILTVLVVAISLIGAGSIASVILGAYSTHQILRIRGEIAFSLGSHVKIYVDGGFLGNDQNDGMTSATPFQTLQRAIQELQTFHREICVIEILPGVLDLGSDAILQLFPGSTRCGSITIQGTRTNIVTDTVQSIHHFGPFDTWKTITSATLNTLVPDRYAGDFIENVDQSRIYVVRTNTNNSIGAIIGDLSSNFTLFEIPHGTSLFQTRRNAWYIGERFSLYQLASKIFFSKHVRVLLDEGNVLFKDLEIEGDVNATWHNPVSATPRVTFQGCRITTRSVIRDSEDSDPGFTGSMMLTGVVINGDDPDSQFNTFERGACVKSESIWLNHSAMAYMADCHVFFMEATNITDSIFVASSNFFGYGINILESRGIGAITLFDTQYYIYGMHIYRTIPSKFPGVGGFSLSLESGSKGNMQQLKIWHYIPFGFSRTVYLVNSHLYARRTTIEIEGNLRTLELVTQSKAVFSESNVRLVGVGVISFDSDLFFSGGSLHVQSNENGIVAYGSSQIGLGSTPFFPLATTFNTTDFILVLARGARATALVSNATNPNDPSKQLILGGSGSVPWATGNDLASVAPQNCFFTTG